jgi:hypothetical protein
MAGEFQAAACALHAGEIDFSEFVSKTGARWRWWAKRLTRRETPAWLAPEDVEQELLLAAWLAARKYDPARGPSAAAYLEWTASKVATKRVYKALGCKLHREPGAPQFERAMGCGGVADASEEILDQAMDQQRCLERGQAYEMLLALCRTRVQRLVVEALRAAGGEEDAAAVYLYARYEARLACRLLSEEHARTTVRKVVTQLCDEYGLEEEAS